MTIVLGFSFLLQKSVATCRAVKYPIEKDIQDEFLTSGVIPNSPLMVKFKLLLPSFPLPLPLCAASMFSLDLLDKPSIYFC